MIYRFNPYLEHSDSAGAPPLSATLPATTSAPAPAGAKEVRR